MKKSIILFLALLLAASAAEAYDFSAVSPSGHMLYYRIVGSEVYVTDDGGSGADPVGNLIIPASVSFNSSTYSVAGIDSRVFYECTGLTSVSIPASVATIGYEAFYGCYKIISITLPSTLSSVGTGAFYLVKNIAYHGAAQGAPWGALCLNGFVDGYMVYTSPAKTYLAGCASNAYYANIPATVDTIGPSAFYKCQDLDQITLPSSVTCIGIEAFCGCSGASVITLSSSLAYIGIGAFSGCTGVTSITVPTGVSYIGAYAFEQVRNVAYDGSATAYGSWGALCVNGYIEGNLVFTTPAKTNLAGCPTTAASAVIPASVIHIGAQAFSGCTLITSITVPDAVNGIGEYAFADCTGLDTVTLGKSLTYIDHHAFANCSGLTGITLPYLLRSIGNSAFSGCSGIASVVAKPRTPPTIHGMTFSAIPGTTPVVVPCGDSCRNAYIRSWSHFDTVSFLEDDAYRISATSSDLSRGDVQVLEQPACETPSASIEAVPCPGYHFAHWSDYSTQRSRTLQLFSDTSLVAYFAPNDGSECIDAAEASPLAVRVEADFIVVEGLRNEPVRLLDCAGRCLQSLPAAVGSCTLRAPAAGICLLQVGSRPAQRVVVAKN